MTVGGSSSTRALVGGATTPIPTRRDTARALVGERGLASAATEIVVRTAMHRVPPSMVDRARVLLRRFFSDAPWRGSDDAALAAIVGPGTDHHHAQLDDELVLVVAFRASSLRVDVEFTASDPAVSPTPANGSEPAQACGSVDPSTSARRDSLLDTFDLSVVPEADANPKLVRFLTGPGTTGTGGWIRNPDQTPDDRIARLLRTFVDITGVLNGPGFVAVELGDEDRWDDLLEPILDAVDSTFGIGPGQVGNDHQLDRARLEFTGVDPRSARGINRVRDALGSPDAGVRQIAVTLMEYDDPFSAQKAWRIALDDRSRAVRRAAVIAMAAAEREELRPLLERALGEGDARARYHAVIGLGRIGVERSRRTIERALVDSDARVRLATRRMV